MMAVSPSTAHRSPDRPIHLRLELLFRKRRRLAGAIGKVLVYTASIESWLVVSVGPRATRRSPSHTRALRKLPGLPINLHQLAEPALRTLGDLGRVSDQLAVTGLLGVDLHRDGGLADTPSSICSSSRHAFGPAVSPKALKSISRTIRRWALHHRSDKVLKEPEFLHLGNDLGAEFLSRAVLRGLLSMLYLRRRQSRVEAGNSVTFQSAIHHR
jgi:hypothetical protein